MHTKSALSDSDNFVPSFGAGEDCLEGLEVCFRAIFVFFKLGTLCRVASDGCEQFIYKE